MKVKQVRTKDEIEEVRLLFREYEAYLDVDLCFQSFEEELAGLPGKYAPPEGELLIGVDDNKILGCVAVRSLGGTACEMKRLYVRPGARGTGMGRELVRRIIGSARDLGYAVMRLDTLDKLTEAIGLYRSFGFRDSLPYYENPLPGVVYLELDLKHSLDE